ncbi:hypothetical protein C8Q79DRAFT_1100071, partial [Trametes meyenii]
MSSEASDSGVGRSVEIGADSDRGIAPVGAPARPPPQRQVLRFKPADIARPELKWQRHRWIDSDKHCAHTACRCPSRNPLDKNMKDGTREGLLPSRATTIIREMRGTSSLANWHHPRGGTDAAAPPPPPNSSPVQSLTSIVHLRIHRRAKAASTLQMPHSANKGSRWSGNTALTSHIRVSGRLEAHPGSVGATRACRSPRSTSYAASRVRNRGSLCEALQGKSASQRQRLCQHPYGSNLRTRAIRVDESRRGTCHADYGNVKAGGTPGPPPRPVTDATAALARHTIKQAAAVNRVRTRTIRIRMGPVRVGTRDLDAKSNGQPLQGRGCLQAPQVHGCDGSMDRWMGRWIDGWFVGWWPLAVSRTGTGCEIDEMRMGYGTGLGSGLHRTRAGASLQDILTHGAGAERGADCGEGMRGPHQIRAIACLMSAAGHSGEGVKPSLFLLKTSHVCSPEALGELISRNDTGHCRNEEGKGGAMKGMQDGGEYEAGDDGRRGGAGGVSKRRELDGRGGGTGLGGSRRCTADEARGKASKDTVALCFLFEFVVQILIASSEPSVSVRETADGCIWRGPYPCSPRNSVNRETPWQLTDAHAVRSGASTSTSDSDSVRLFSHPPSVACPHTPTFNVRTALLMLTRPSLTLALPAHPATLTSLKPKLCANGSQQDWNSLRSDLLRLSTLAESLSKHRPRAKKVDDWLQRVDELDHQGVTLWNASVVQKDIADDVYHSACAAMRLASFHVIGAGMEHKPGIQTLIHLLQLASKAGSSLADVGDVTLAAGVLGSAAKYVDQLRAADDPQNAHAQARARTIVLYYSSRMEAAFREHND